MAKREFISKRAPIYADLTDEKWQNWRWQLSNRINSVEEFEKIIPLTDSERKALSAPGLFRVDITPYFISLIDPDNPNDPIALYTTGLCLTWVENEKSLNLAEELIIKAIKLNGKSEYFHQTLGYIFEVQNSVYKKQKTLEKALESYKKAWFLNDHVNNPQNAANLLLNTGNAYFYLKRYTSAFEYYFKRYNLNFPFDNESTEMLFLKRLSECSFQSEKNELSIEVTEKLLALINLLLDPHNAPARASSKFTDIHKYLMNQVFNFAGSDSKSLKFRVKIKNLTKKQIDISIKLSSLSQKRFPPPSNKWDIFQKEMTELLKDQEKIVHETFQLIKEIKLSGGGEKLPKPENMKSITALCFYHVKKALTLPGRVVQLKAEMLDRLALSCQEKGLREKAVENFMNAFNMNKKLKNFKNLVRNRRSAAHNTYMIALGKTGMEREKYLKKASKGFKEVLLLVEKYGVPEKKKKGPLLGITLQQSLNSVTGTKAAFGFSKEQELRLAHAFLMRINIELGKIFPAITAIEKQLEDYPIGKKVGSSNIFGVSLLYHRAGLLYNAVGDFEKSFNCSLSST